MQFTPPGSPASIQFGTGMTDLAPGTLTDLYLIVDDLDAARDELMRLGADVSEVWHGQGVHPTAAERAPGRDPDGSRTALRLVQRSRRQPLAAAGDQAAAPGAGVSMDVADLAELLHETSLRHGAFEAVAPPHDWWDWYAAYMVARQGGAEPDAASEAGNRYMAEVKHIVVPAE